MSEERRRLSEAARGVRFGRFRLHPSRGLTRGRTEVRVTPKALAVLRLLVDRPGEVVSKEDLFRSVWPDTAVSDAALTSCIQELRHALGDDARHPRFIETVHRRGYRFVARTDSAVLDNVPLVSRIPRPHEETPVVGRDAVLDTMLEAYALTEGGVRQVIFVAGEPGVGKTTVVAEFAARVARGGRVRTTMGQCLEHYGAGEPYQPLLDAMTRLCRQAGGGDLIRLLQQCAPSWVPQLPPDLFSSRRARGASAGGTPERMLRELNDALEAISVRQPLLLWIEDLHWSDPSTLDWLGAFAQRPEPARVLLVATFRAADVAEVDHPLRELPVRLRVKRLCREIALEGLNESAVAEYIARRYPPAPRSSDAHGRLARLVHQRTGGNALFIVNVLSDLAGRGVLLERHGTWTTQDDLQASDLGIPDDIRRMIDGQIECLQSPEQRLLEIASVAGASFSAAAVAAGARLPLIEVERILAALARGHRFLRQTDAVEWPDGTMAAGFAFRHALYREVLYQRIAAGHRAELHQEIGTREERAYRERSAEIAAELAMHFDEGRDVARAIDYLQQAADNARRRSAYREARLHYERALALVDRIAAGRHRTERELLLRIGLGSVIVAIQGWAAHDVEDNYVRAQALCREIGETPRLFPALWGLWLFYWGRGPLGTAHDISARLLTLAGQADDRTLRLQAHHAAWATAFSRGDFEAAQGHAAAGLNMYDATQDAVLAATYGGHDAGACARQFSARALAFMGHTGPAIEQSHEAIRHAEALADPFSLAIAHVFAAAVDHARRDPASTREHAIAAARIAQEQEFRLLLAWASVFAGWVSVEEGCCEEGLRQIHQGVTDALATGSHQFVSHFLGILAESRLRAGACEPGLQAIDDALDIVHRTGERFYEAELYRLRGELLLGARPDDAVPQADEAFSRALAIAQTQGARLLTIRSAISRARLWQRLGRHHDARQLLQTSCGALDEAIGRADLADVKALLAEA
jgi:DNA-binding winged helix-turn-helix (wHTH) protein/predicted ATPase